MVVALSNVEWQIRFRQTRFDEIDKTLRLSKVDYRVIVAMNDPAA